MRINEILSQQPEIADEAALALDNGAPGEDARLSTSIQGEIEFRNLNFSYNGTSVLKDINLRIPAGSSLAIVGPTGRWVRE